MSCETIHKEGKSRFCSECGKQLFDNIVEKMNKELLPELIKYHKKWFDDSYSRSTIIIKIYEFISENSLKIPDRIFFEYDYRSETITQKFLSVDEYNSKYPKHALYANKLAKINLYCVCGIPWLKFIPTEYEFDNIEKLEEKYDIPLPDKIFDRYLEQHIESIEKTFKYYSDNKIVREYLLSIIKKM